MKKIIVFLAAVAVAVSASAQKTAVTGNKFGDNWYVGVNAGVATPTTHHSWVSDLTPNFGVRVGKNLTTVFGLALDGNLYGNNTIVNIKMFSRCSQMLRSEATTLKSVFKVAVQPTVFYLCHEFCHLWLVMMFWMGVESLLS